MADDENDVKRITFRIPQDKADELERTIDLAKGLGILDADSNKSTLLRGAVDEIIDDLEERIEEETGIDPGNSIPAETAAD